MAIVLGVELQEINESKDEEILDAYMAVLETVLAMESTVIEKMAIVPGVELQEINESKDEEDLDAHMAIVTEDMEMVIMETMDMGAMVDIEVMWYTGYVLHGGNRYGYSLSYGMGTHGAYSQSCKRSHGGYGGGDCRNCACLLPNTAN